MADVKSSVMCEAKKNVFIVTFSQEHNFWGAIDAKEVATNDGAGSGSDNSTTIEGNIGITQEYQGCPYCGNQQFVQCYECGNLSCYDGNSGTSYCSYCDIELTIEGDIKELEAREDSTETLLSSNDNSPNSLTRK